MAVQAPTMYVRPLLHHLLTSPGLPTMLFTPGPLLTSSMTGSHTYAISEASTKHVSITVYAESPIYHWQPHWGTFEDSDESLPFRSGSSLPSSGNNVWSSLRLRELRKLLEAQGAMRASIAYGEV